MAIIIDNSKPGTVSRAFLIKATDCLGNRLMACWLDIFVISFFLLLPAYLNIPYILWFFVIAAILYFPLLEGLSGYTLGKYICRIRVINSEGKVPGIKKAIIRTLLRIVEVNPILLGAIPAGLTILFSKSRQRLGDMLANTYVVRVKDLIAIQSLQEPVDSKIETRESSRQ